MLYRCDKSRSRRPLVSSRRLRVEETYGKRTGRAASHDVCCCLEIAEKAFSLLFNNGAQKADRCIHAIIIYTSNFHQCARVSRVSFHHPSAMEWRSALNVCGQRRWDDSRSSSGRRQQEADLAPQLEWDKNIVYPRCHGDRFRPMQPVTSNCLPIGPIRDGASFPFPPPVPHLHPGLYRSAFMFPCLRSAGAILFASSTADCRRNPRRHPHFHMPGCRRNTSANSTSRLRA